MNSTESLEWISVFSYKGKPMKTAPLEIREHAPFRYLK
jgi:hypothetical protein